MRGRLRRWLLRQETVADDVAGGLLAGLFVVLIFRFAFGDSWLVAGVAATATAVISAVASALTRRRRQSSS